MKKHIYDERNGLHYTLGEDGYYYPDLALPEQKYEIGRFGLQHLNYLKNHKKIVYTELLESGKLNAFLHDIDTQAYEMYNRLIVQYAEVQGVTEKLKAENQMEWVQRMNNICNAVSEVVNTKIVFR